MTHLPGMYFLCIKDLKLQVIVIRTYSFIYSKSVQILRHLIRHRTETVDTVTESTKSEEIFSQREIKTTAIGTF
jgi:hypothetical protein